MANTSHEPTSTARSASAPTLPERRRSPRRKPPQLVYVEFGRENGGMLKDISEGGLRFHLMNPVAPGQRLPFAVGIDALRRFEGVAEMIWTDASGKSGGLAFAEISDAARQTLQAWLSEIDGPQHAADDAPPKIPAPQMVAAPVATAPPVTAPPLSLAPVFPVSPAAAIPSTPLPEPILTPTPPSPATFRNVPAPRELTPSPDPALLEIGSQFIAAPVSREVWQRAAREEIAPGDRTRRPLAAAKAKAMHEEVRTATRVPSAVAESNLPAGTIDSKPPDVTCAPTLEIYRGKEKASESLTPAADPFRDFLKQPIGAQADVDDSLGREGFSENAAQTSVSAAGTNWTTTRLMLIFALAAIIGGSAAFTAIAYRQSIGEAIIRLGEKISGEPRPARGPQTQIAPVSSPDTPAIGTQAASGSHVTERRSAVKARQEEPVSPLPPSSTRPSAIPQAVRMDEPQGTTPPQREPSAGQTQLAAGREIIPGKPRRPPEDVASLWLAVENGDTAAEILLAEHYAKGEGLDKNCEQARVLLQAAAKHGSASAAQRLAQLAKTCQ